MNRKNLSFSTKLERIAQGMDYFAVSIPEKITAALKTKGPVPVMARMNGSEPFLASLYPVGGGRHYLRVRNKICKAGGIDAGDKVRVAISVRDRTDEISIPKDVASALRAERVTEGFAAIPIGQRSFLLRKIEEAVQPETRKKRIREAVEEAHRRRERGTDSKAAKSGKKAKTKHGRSKKKG